MTLIYILLALEVVVVLCISYFLIKRIRVMMRGNGRKGRGERGKEVKG